MKMPIENARGFSLADKNPYSIVINLSDSINAKIFTLFHEYAHILLKQPGICNIGDNYHNYHNHKDIEKWCDKFAGYLLLPRELLEQDNYFKSFKESEHASKESLTILKSISNRYKISISAILITLYNYRFISNQRCKEEQSILIKAEPKAKISKIIIKPEKKCLNEKGEKLISLVLKNKEKGLINYADTSEYLNLKLKYVDKLQAMVGE